MFEIRFQKTFRRTPGRGGYVLGGDESGTRIGVGFLSAVAAEAVLLRCYMASKVLMDARSFYERSRCTVRFEIVLFTMTISPILAFGIVASSIGDCSFGQISTAQRLQIVSRNLHCDAALDVLQGQHHAQAVLLPHHDPLHAGQGA